MTDVDEGIGPLPRQDHLPEYHLSHSGQSCGEYILHKLELAINDVDYRTDFYSRHSSRLSKKDGGVPQREVRTLNLTGPQESDQSTDQVEFFGSAEDGGDTPIETLNHLYRDDTVYDAGGHIDRKSLIQLLSVVQQSPSQGLSAAPTEENEEKVHDLRLLQTGTYGDFIIRFGPTDYVVIPAIPPDEDMVYVGDHETQDIASDTAKAQAVSVQAFS